MYNYMHFRHVRSQKRFCSVLTNYNLSKTSNECRYRTYSNLGRKSLSSVWIRNDEIYPYISNSTSVRNVSLGRYLLDKAPLKPSSKIETTVQRIRDSKDLENQPAQTQVEKQVVKKSLGRRVWDELVHYYHGFRLLFIDIRVSSGLAWRVLNGKTLTRREHNLLVRTVGDMFRLVPFSVFIIVPFLEFALPIYLKFFPGALPSTFQTSSEREEKMKKELKMKIEMARFLQTTLDEMAVQSGDRNSQAAKEFVDWFHKMRTSGKEVTNEEIMKFSKLFNDEITLESLSRGQLVALCRVLEVQTLGPNNILRFQLRMKLRSLAADDKLIQKEGIDSLNVYELQQASRARGMRAYGLSEDKLRQQLSQWLDLSLNQKVPPSLLLLSRALMLPERIPTTDKLKATISVLPDSIVKHTKAAIAETEGKIDNKIKYELLKEEVQKCKEERDERREEQKRKEKLIDPAPVIEAKPSEEIIDPAEKKKETQISTKDLGVLEDAIDHLGMSKKKMILEKEKLEDLKEELADYQEDLNELKQVTADCATPELKETKAASRLYNRVNKMISKLDCVVQQLENKEKKLKMEIERTPETDKQEEMIQIDELLCAIRKLQKVPNDSVLKQIEVILSKMDADHDGSIKVDDVLKVIQMIGKENVNLSEKQLEEIIDLIDKEEILEVEDKIEKALQKDKEQDTVKTLNKIDNVVEERVPEDVKIECKSTEYPKLTCRSSVQCTPPQIPPDRIQQPDKDKPSQL